MDYGTLFMRDVITLSSYKNGGRPTPHQLMKQIKKVAERSPSLRFSDLRDKHYQQLAAHFPTLPIRDSIDSFKDAIKITFQGVRQQPSQRELSLEEVEDTGHEESPQSDSDSFTESDPDSPPSVLPENPFDNNSANPPVDEEGQEGKERESGEVIDFSPSEFSPNQGDDESSDVDLVN